MKSQTPTELAPSRRLTEHHWSIQFTCDATRAAFLQKCSEIAGGATVFSTLHHETLFVGVETESQLKEIQSLVAAGGFAATQPMRVTVTPDKHGYGFILPMSRNADQFGHKRPMFDASERSRLITRLRRDIGHLVIHPCHGAWVSADGQLYEDASQLLLFPQLRTHRLKCLLDAVREHVLSSPEWDQLAWYFGGGGEGYLAEAGS